MKAGTWAQEHGAVPGSGLLLVFPVGARPDRERALAALAAIERVQVSHDPASFAKPAERPAERHPAAPVSIADAAADWLELLRDGMTFDLLGLAPSPGLAIPLNTARVALREDLSGGAFEAVGLFPGPHIAGGAATLPVVRTQLALASDLLRVWDDAVALVWLPAAIATAPALAGSLIAEWLAGGAFPVPVMVGFAQAERGGLDSSGLAFFIGKELSLDRALAADRIAGTRLAMRIVHELVAIGTLADERLLVLPDGREVLLSPDHSGRTLLARAP